MVGKELIQQICITFASEGFCAYLLRFSFETSMKGPPGSVNMEAYSR